MIPGNAKIVKCPYCGTEKMLMTLISGNTVGAEYWSDNKRIAPMLPSVSPVQKCPNCKKYYFESENQHGEDDEESFELGELTFPEWKEAYAQFMSEDIDKDTMVFMYLWLIHSYNDYYYRSENAPAPTKDDYDFFVMAVIAFNNLFKWSQAPNTLLKAELYREAGKMKECADVLSSIPYDSLQDYEKSIYMGIKERAQNNDNKVFKLTL